MGPNDASTDASERRRSQQRDRTVALVRLQLSLRLALVVLAILALWVVGGGTVAVRAALTAGIFFGYLPLAYFLGMRLTTSESTWLPIAIVVLDITAGVGGVLILPEMRTVVLFGYVALIINESIGNGRQRGLAVAIVTVAAATVTDLVIGIDTVREALGLLQFAALAIALPLLVEALNREHRQNAAHLSRLHHALSTLAATPDLEGTFETIAATAERAVGASFVAVMTFDTDDRRSLSAAAVTAQGIGSLDRIPARIDVASEIPARSPSELAVRSGEPVVVEDFEHDARFGRWAGIARRQGIAAMVSVPLRTGPTTVGTLNAYFDAATPVPEEDVDLLVAYAEGAALSILRAQAYERERAAAVALRDAERIKSEFTAAITHELRTPLTTVRGFVETMLLHEDRLTAEERRRMLEVSRRNAIDLSHRISSLLEFSKLEADHVIVEPHPQLLAPALRMTIDNCAGLLADHELVLAVEEDVLVDLDELALEHVVSNLISNAVKYAPEGSRIEVTARTDARFATISVADHGMGIPVDEVPHVFERFYRGADRGHGRRGTGIGLSIVQRYVELGGGTIWVDSTWGEGTTFSFTIPLSTPESAASALTAEMQTQARREAAGAAVELQDRPGASTGAPTESSRDAGPRAAVARS